MPRFIAVNTIRRFTDAPGPDPPTIYQVVSGADLDERDKRLAVELISGTVKYLGLIDNVLKIYVKRKPPEKLYDLLRISVFEIMFNRSPDYAVVNEAVNTAKRLRLRQTGFVNAVLRNFIRDMAKSDQRLDPAAMPPHIRYSLPGWLYDRLSSLYKSEFAAEIGRVSLLPALLTVRVREKSISVNDFIGWLKKHNIGHMQLEDPSFVRILDKAEFWSSGLHEKGFCQIQDYSSGLAVQLFDFSGNDDVRILDMCAAPGGKSLQILDILNGRGTLVANDAQAIRLAKLEQNLRDSGWMNYRIGNDDGRNIDGQFTHILVDAPCSGLGTLRKHPDLRWQRSLKDLRRLGDLQLQLLTSAAGLLENGGELVYSTCTIDPIENQEVIEEFLRNNPEFAFAGDREMPNNNVTWTGSGYLVLPGEDHEGAFFVKLVKS